jgi:hypothetical protein
VISLNTGRTGYFGEYANFVAKLVICKLNLAILALSPRIYRLQRANLPPKLKAKPKKRVFDSGGEVRSHRNVVEKRLNRLRPPRKKKKHENRRHRNGRATGQYRTVANTFVPDPIWANSSRNHENQRHNCCRVFGCVRTRDVLDHEFERDL